MPVITPPPVDLVAILPLLIVSVSAMVVLIVGLFVRQEQSPVLAAISLVGVGAAIVATVALWGQNRVAYSGAVVADDFFVFFGVVCLGIVALTIVLSSEFAAREGFSAGEYYTLLLFTGAGMLVLSSARDLIVLLIGLEVLSISLYVLTGFARERLTSEEAAIKYFLLGAFSLSFLVYGIALMYGATGSTQFDAIATALQSGDLLRNPLLLAACGLILVGFAFKLSLVPFHMWTPDVYEGAPTSITAFMSVGTKAAVFAALLRLLTEALPALRGDWANILWGLAILSMVLGNFAAVTQKNVKRMLAYSGVAQAGYMLIGVVAAGTAGRNALMFYVAAYAVTNLGAFAVVQGLSGKTDENTDVLEFDGLASRSPVLAGAMAIFMLSLAGVPATAGFMAKLYVFNAAIQGGYLDLAIIGVLTSAVATFYYLKMIVAMYMRPADAGAVAIRVPASLALIVVVTVILTIQMGVLPSFQLNAAQATASLLALH
ncbi:MAG TPA: NADH-quinone oxidoreductase subunit N [Chloroflexota bacterium]|nr:NADH-quinone oxidoreductase subunit N [Chloroflexota bacterium]